LEDHFVDCDKDNDPEWMKIVKLKEPNENIIMTDEIFMVFTYYYFFRMKI